MTTNPSNLDLSRLENVRHSAGKITARCPACAENEGDCSGNHLCIFPTGKFACAALSGDPDHRRHIFALVGIAGKREERHPIEVRRWQQQRAKDQRRSRDRDNLVATIQQKRAAIIARHEWMPADVWDDSPQRIDCPLVESDPRHFLTSLFAQTSLVWAGSVTQSGRRHADHWRTVADWQEEENVGPMTTPTVWKPGSINRIATNVKSSPYTVLDFDGFDGRKPETPAELAKHFHDSLALIRWIREGLKWQLAAMIWTGSKSIHAWFETPPPVVLISLKDTAKALGIDGGLIGSPEHPCRLPGHRHEKTGEASRVLWLEERREQWRVKTR